MNQNNLVSIIQHIEEFKNSLEAAHKKFLQKLEDIKKRAVQKAEASQKEKESRSLSQVELELNEL